MARRVVLKKSEVEDHAGRDQHPEDGQQLALGEEVGFAGFVDAVRNLGHALMHRQRLGLQVLPDAEQGADGADDDAEHHQRVARHAAQAGELHLGQVGDFDVRFAAEGGGGSTKKGDGYRTSI